MRRASILIGFILLAVLAIRILVRWDALGLLRNTALLCGSVVAVALPIATFLAVMITRTDLPGRRGLGVALAMLLLLPLYLQAAGWMAGFGLQGWMPLAQLGPVWIEGWRGAVWVHALAAIPWATLIIALGLRFSEGEYEEQALLDASTATVLCRVTLRRAAPAMLVAALWIAVTTAGEMTITDLFQVRTYAEELYTQIRLGAQPSELTISALPGVGLMLLLLTGAHYCAAWLSPTSYSASMRPTRVMPLGAWKWPATLLVAVILLAMGAVPLANLAYKAGVVVTADSSGFHRSWSLAKGLRIVAESPLRNAREFGWTFALAGLAASAGLVVGLPLAWWARAHRLASGLTLLLVAVCLAMPGPLIGLGIIWLMNRREMPWLTWLYDDSLAAPGLALLIRVLPLTVLILWHALRSIPTETLEAAALDGAGPMARFWLIALPQRLAAVGIAWLTAIAVCIGDLSATILVVPPGVMTIANLLFDRLHGAQEDDVAGIALSLVIVFGLLAVALAWLARRWQQAIDARS